MDTRYLVKHFNDKLSELQRVFKSKQNDYFFTEKELHSYFYHLCLKEGCFEFGDFNLIHTEYPTPFKCETLKEEPFIVMANDNSKQQRAHIDLVLINPNFVSWVKNNNKDNRLISGIGGKLFDSYIQEFKKDYSVFCDELGESILLYALEFKFLRHTYVGGKYAIQEIQQDVNKLTMLNDFRLGANSVSFSANVKSVVFVGERTRKMISMLEDAISDRVGICEIIEK